MKKIIAILLAITLLTALSSCNSKAPTPPKNTISTAELSAEQQEIVDLFSNNHELMIFDFNTDKTYRSFEVWVEVYKDGELVERPAGVSTYMDTGDELGGRVAVIANKTETGFQWMVSVIQGGGKGSHAGTSEIVIDTGFARAYGPMSGSSSIEDGKEIVLYSSLYSDRSTLNAYDAQTIQERPELLYDYAYVQLIKCRFTS